MSRLTLLAGAAVALALAAAEARAQSHDHHAPPPTDPHAGHQPPADPHAAHRTPQAQADPHAAHQPATDPHAAHRAPEAQPDPHAGHQPPPAADPHAGHHPTPAQPDPHAGHRAPAGAPPEVETSADNPGRPPETPPPPEAFSGPAHAADALFDPAAMAAARDRVRAEHGGMRSGAVIADRLEAGFSDGHDGYLWDVQGWYGGDVRRFWWKTEGEGESGGDLESAEVQALYSQAVTPYFDVQAGLRYDLRPQPERAHLVLGIQGLAPYMFEVDAAAFLSTEGDLTARIEAEADYRLTQHLMLQPRVELELAGGDIPELGLGAGLTSAEVGARLRYEIVREFAPYVGIERESALGATRDLVEAAGGDPDATRLVVGVAAWF